MRTRTTRKQIDLIERMQKRDHDGKPVIGGSRRYYTRQDHIRAEYNLAMRRIRKLRKKYRPYTNRDNELGYSTAINDVLEAIRELKP